MSKKMTILTISLTVVAVGQIICAILLYNPDGVIWVINLGWGVMMISAIFGWLPIFTFRRKGEVKGTSYIHTTKLVNSGIFSIVRHPQYLAGVLISVALLLISQHWIVAALGLVAVCIYYFDTFDEEKGCIEKFGDAYLEYMERVPRMNFISGTIRAVRRR